MYNKNAWASLWHKRKLPQEIWFPVSEHPWIYPHLFTEIKKSNAVPSGTVKTNKAPYFGSNRSWGQRRRTGFLKPFRHFYMTELINSLLIPRGVRHRIFLHLSRWSMLAHCLPVWPWFLSVSIDFPLSFYFCYYYSFLYFSVIWVFQWWGHIAFNLFCFLCSHC